jgi:YHS domain-containing protein
MKLVYLRPLAWISVLLLLGGCNAMLAQNPSSPLKPVNAAHVGDESRLMLKGADVVAYFTEGRYVQGQSKFRSEYEEVAFYFASAGNKTLFDTDPKKYLPQYGGFCTNGIVYAIPWGGDADTWSIIDGKLYIFGGQASKDAFDLDVKDNLALAEKYWKDEVAGSNSYWQRSKRLVYRVYQYMKCYVLY